MSEHTTNRRYKGYEVEEKPSRRSNRNRPWFWKVLGISLLITALIIAAVVFGLLHKKKQNTQYIEKINASNTIDALLKDHKSVTITCSYSHLEEGADYTTTRQVKKDKKGNYYSYLKKKGSDNDYKEVIKNKEIYRDNGKYVRYYGLISDDYEKKCVKEIEDDTFCGNEEDLVQNEKERNNMVIVQTVYEVKNGDVYVTRYGFNAGDKIEKNIVMNKETGIVLSEQEKCEDEVFFTYGVEFDKKVKVPSFFKTLKKTEETRTCKVYSDYNGDEGKKYSFTIPVDVYFDVFDHDGYKTYEDKKGKKEFGTYQMETQNPETDLSLYVKKAEKDK